MARLLTCNLMNYREMNSAFKKHVIKLTDFLIIFWEIRHYEKKHIQ